MLARIAGELDDQQLPALRAAADAVGSGYVGAPLLHLLQGAAHLSVGEIGEVHRGEGLLVTISLHSLVCCRKKKKKGMLQVATCFYLVFNE